MSVGGMSVGDFAKPNPLGDHCPLCRRMVKRSTDHDVYCPAYSPPGTELASVVFDSDDPDYASALELKRKRLFAGLRERTMPTARVFYSLIGSYYQFEGGAPVGPFDDIFEADRAARDEIIRRAENLDG